ncbi:MAG: hypothetical protein R3265_15200 [Hyphomonas sp.]|nr:hypothetical protein [Hyphomonas sp.]
MMKRLASCALIAAFAHSFTPAEAKCEYSFSGSIMVVHNGVERPMPDVKVRVRREHGTGLGRNFVRTDKNGHFSGSWSFDEDQNGVLPGSKDINFAIQIQLEDHDRFKVVKGGWTDTPWDTVKTARGQNCTPFIYTEPFRIDADALQMDDLNRRAFIYMVHSRLLDALEAEGVGLKNRIEVIYPDRHIYGRDGSWFLHKSHIEANDWNRMITLIHEVMHQWDVNWLKGEATLTCLTDAHHEPPERRGSKRCSGFMEGFAEATAQALYNEAFADDRFFWMNKDRRTPMNGPQSHEALRNDSNGTGALRNVDEAERNDVGWRNFLQFMIWNWDWEVFNERGNADLYNLSTCKPRHIPVFELLRALKAEAPDHGGDRATFTWFTNILEARIPGFSSRDTVYYQLLGNPAADPVDIQKAMCPEGRAALENLAAPLGRPDVSAIGKVKPKINRNTPVIKPKGLKD